MGLPEILRFSTVSSKYFKNVSGELCCLYITPQIIFAALVKCISTHRLNTWYYFEVLVIESRWILWGNEFLQKADPIL